MTASVHNIRSIQSEQLLKAATTERTTMDIDEVDEYVHGASDAVVACRERGRHLYESTRRRGGSDTGVFSEVVGGYLVRRLPCTCCGLVERVERWETRKHAGRLRYFFVDYSTVYKTGPDGERYLAKPGHGRMTPRLVREALITDALSGMSLTEVKKQARGK